MFSREEEVAATRIIAAAETRITAVKFDLVDSFGWDDGDATIAAGAEGSTAGATTAWGAGSCGSGGRAVGALPDGTVLGGILLARILLAGTIPGGTTALGTSAGKTGLGGAWAYPRAKPRERWAAGHEK